MTILSPSAIPSYNNCARKQAAALFQKEIAEKGFSLRKLQNNIGAAVGTAIHAGVAHLLRAKRDGQPGALKEGPDIALAELDNKLKEEVFFDKTTPTRDQAVEQIKTQLSIYLKSYLPTARPKRIEETLTAVMTEDLVLQGTLDYQDEADIIHDSKFGARRPEAQGQLGAYSLLVRSHGDRVSGLQVDWIKRPGKKLIPSDPVIIKYDVSDSERLAESTIHRMQRDLTEFKNTGDPYVFAANPMTYLCSEKFCPAHGTDFCKLGAKNKEEE